MSYYYRIPGNPIVKKNTQKIGTKKRKNGTSYPFIYYTAAYKNWAAEARKVIAKSSVPVTPINQPILLVCKFFIQHNYVVDVSALYEGIQDILKEMGVIVDDNHNVIAGHDGSRVFIDPDDPHTEVTLLPIFDIPLPRPKNSPLNRTNTEF